MGSSPRVRGKPVRFACSKWKSGLIPACAGKTRLGVNGLRAARAHPRVCGENWNSGPNVKSRPGSSPRVRGKRSVATYRLNSRGLIPACAGKTFYTPLPAPPNRAHPRVCGENFDLATHFIDEAGSSPRVRGKHSHSYSTVSACGLIPACAGKTLYLVEAWPYTGAHPRVCGENDLNCGAALSAAGSSPRVRGKREVCQSG